MEILIYAAIFILIIIAVIYWIYRTIKTATRVLKTSGFGAVWNIASIKILTTISASILTIIFVQILTTKTSLLDRTSSTPRDESSMAFVQCQKFIKNRLKAPSSAEFAIIDYKAKKLPNQQFEITSHFEAQNSFGVKLKNSFVCEVQWNGENPARIDNWNLINLTISE